MATVKLRNTIAFQQIPQFMATLKQVDSMSARTLELIILTPCPVRRGTGGNMG